MGLHVTVVGLGAMGSGMARTILKSDKVTQVIGFDLSRSAMEAFHHQAQKVKPAPLPETLAEAVTDKTDIVVLVLQNEAQCENICFSGETTLVKLLASRQNVCVVLCSTVSPVWAQAAANQFRYFVDCPISGGPVKAAQGALIMMASGSTASLDKAKPVIDAMGDKIHIIEGGPGMGSTVKMVHQLLAGVHIVAAAEALALAARAGLDVNQVYEIVNGAAGASWMFHDRGQRMLKIENQEIKSQIQIFVKDLGIVQSEARRLQFPVPIASNAFQQFISAVSLGYANKDDSQVIKVYETMSGVSVGERASKRQKFGGDEVGDLWQMEDGSNEQILEVADEPRHKVVLSNEYVRAIRVEFPPNDTTVAHRHAEDSLYFFLVENGLEVVNHVKGNAPVCDFMEFGEVRFGTHKSDKPLIHKITNKTDKQMLCIDAEVLKQPPVISAIPLVAEMHECVKTRDRCRVYKLTLEPGKSATVSYNFFHLTVVLQPGVIEKYIPSADASSHLIWTEQLERGHVTWKEPLPSMRKTNVGKTTIVEYIAEWC